MQRKDLLDEEGENLAVRTFLRQYILPGITVGAMRDCMELAGWDGCWPEFVTKAHAEDHLTKAGAQIWLRHLFSLEQQLAPVAGGVHARADQVPNYAHDHAGIPPGLDARFERELKAVIGNPAIKVVGRLPAAATVTAVRPSLSPRQVLFRNQVALVGWAKRLSSSEDCSDIPEKLKETAKELGELRQTLVRIAAGVTLAWQEHIRKRTDYPSPRDAGFFEAGYRAGAIEAANTPEEALVALLMQRIAESMARPEPAGDKEKVLMVDEAWTLLNAHRARVLPPKDAGNA